MLRRIIYILGLVVLSVSHLFSNGTPENSVLSTGKWIKLGVLGEGVYAINYGFLSLYYGNVGDIDPTKISIYGNGGGMLPQVNGDFRYDDLQENAIYIEGEEDGSMDPGDYILFYADSPDDLYYDSDNQKHIYQQNIYSDTVFYFLTVNEDENGLRIQDQANVSSSPTTNITTGLTYSYYEPEDLNFLLSGRGYYGSKFETTLIRDYEFSFPGIVPGVEMKIQSVVVAEAHSPSSFSLVINDETIGTQVVSPVPDIDYSERSRERDDVFTVNTDILNGQESFEIELTYNKNEGELSNGRLDYFFITAPRTLKYYNNYTVFRLDESLLNGSSELEVDNVNSETLIWDVTNPLLVVNQEYNLNGTTGNFNIINDTYKEYVIINKTASSPPIYVGEVENQNLHAINVPDLLIVTSPMLLSEAERLAQFREGKDGIDVQVVTTTKIYNEFSSGAQDVTAIRDYAKCLYDRDSVKFKYLLLFGKGSFDYKDFIKKNSTQVPIYQSRESLNPLTTYGSDDYYGFMEDDEGEWAENDAGNHTLEIGVGRLPAETINESQIMVDKIIHYESSLSALGDWKNNIVFVADDGDGELHQKDAEKLTKNIDTAYINLNVNKIYLDAFDRPSSGSIAPKVNKAILEAIDRGALLLNFTGHGNENLWASENIFNIDMIKELDNLDHLPIFITATCEFGRHDNPNGKSGGENLMLNPNGGAVAMLTTSRPVYADSNFKINEVFYNALIAMLREDRIPTLGDVMIDSKNASWDSVKNRNFSLLGDPSMKLAFPLRSIKLTEFNGSPFTSDTLKALDLVTLEGEIVDYFDSIDNNFNGVLDVIVFDNPSTHKTLGQGDNDVLEYLVRDHILFDGKATINNGRFQISFVVPKNIDYSYNTAKVSMYASADSSLIDASGASVDLIVGGNNEDAVADNEPPTIQLYMDDTTFISGGLTGSNTLLLTKLSDESGINITGNGIGQDIVAILDEEEEIVLNKFYTADIDTYQSGWISYPIDGIEEGSHTITLTVWDTYNNESEATIEFFVGEPSELTLHQVMNYPNPFNQSTTFLIDHDKAGDDLEIDIQIFSPAGELIKSLNTLIYNSPSRIDNIMWDLDINPIYGGIYIAKVIVHSLSDDSKNHKYQRLVIVN